MTGSGRPGCPCTDASAVLASFDDRACRTPSSGEEPGVRLGPPSGLRACVPLAYGSSSCLQHDLLHDEPACAIDRAGEAEVPPYCFRSWCYVDPVVCKRDSEEVVYGSSYFAHEASGSASLFYSYSTCNSTVDDWLDHVHDEEKHLVGGVVLTASIPKYQVPIHYKRDRVSGEPLVSVGDEYYNDSVPYDGIYPRYMKELVTVSNGDIEDVVYTYRSRASQSLHPTSNFTAVVQDIENGLYDMGVGPFWVTSERLSMVSLLNVLCIYFLRPGANIKFDVAICHSVLRQTPFTTAFSYDKNFLVVPRHIESLEQEVLKVLSPFTWGAWLCILGVILLAAMLSVWFSDPVSEPQRDRIRWRGMSRQRRNKVAYARLAADMVLEKGIFFCSAGIEQDRGSSFPHKVMSLGFAFFILITVSAYVANLAAFLTRPVSGGIVSVEEAINDGVTICAHPVVREELETAHPHAIFHFTEKDVDILGMIDDFAEGKCGALVLGWEDNTIDVAIREALCENELVFTDSLVIEMPMAFPVSPKLAPAVSYWITEAHRFHDISIKEMTEEYLEEV
ncbi:hypothetical protein ACHAWF_014536 [Thalassiosira exigua]